MTAQEENKDIDLIDLYLGEFFKWQGQKANYIPGTAKEIFKIKYDGPLPILFEKLIDRVVLESYIYNVRDLKYHELHSAVAFLHEGIEQSKRINQNPGYKLPDGSYGVQLDINSILYEWLKSRPEDIVDIPDFKFCHLIALMQLNDVISVLGKHSLRELSINYTIQLKELYEKAKAQELIYSLSSKLSGHIPIEAVKKLIEEARQEAERDTHKKLSVERRQRAAMGGKAKADINYGGAKQYVRSRIPDITRNKKLSAQKITDKLDQELKAKCGIDLNSECPSFNTLYEWVRKFLKGHDF